MNKSNAFLSIKKKNLIQFFAFTQISKNSFFCGIGQENQNFKTSDNVGVG
jgi:hypothetical protein